MSTSPDRLDEASRARPLPPGPRYATPFQFFRDLRPDPLAYYRRLVAEYGDVACVKMWPRCQVVTARPEHHRRPGQQFRKA